MIKTPLLPTLETEDKDDEKTKSEKTKEYFDNLPNFLPLRVDEDSTPQEKMVQNIKLLVAMILFIIIVYIVHINRDIIFP